MYKDIIFNETVTSAVEVERTLRMADECIIEIRLIETKKEGPEWLYEYEISGQAGRIEKFKKRLHNLEMLKGKMDIL